MTAVELNLDRGAANSLVLLVNIKVLGSETSHLL